VAIFRKSIFRTECDECGTPFPVSSGGVCEQCRRILCGRHLHGSIGQRMFMAFGGTPRCVRCRAGQPVETAR
jgi:hypothetical protein